MAYNPGRIFYIRGTRESKRLRAKDSLAEEIKVRFKRVERQLNDLIDHFFDLTPLAVYITIANADKTLDVVRISSLDVTKQNYSENTIVNGHNSMVTLKNISTRTQQQVDTKLIVKSWIRGTQGDSPAEAHVFNKNGMIAVEGASGPVGKFRALDNTVEDSFMIVKTSTQFTDWTLNIYTGNLHKQLPLGPSRSIQLLSGQEIFSPHIRDHYLLKLQQKKDTLQKTIVDLKHKLSTFGN